MKNISILKSKLSAYTRLMRLDKPIGIFLLLWPTWWGIWAASEGQPSLQILSIFTLGVWLMRSAGCVINDYADRDLDAHVQRTAQRPLAQKTATPTEALVLFFGLISLAGLLLLFLHPKTQLMALGAVALAIIYPWMKRFTYWPQLILGIAFSWGILMAYVELTNTLSIQAWVLFLAGVSWTVVYDTLYALVDKEDDLKIGIKSTAILFGNQVQFLLGLFHILALVFLISFGILMKYTLIYYLFLGVAALLALYQLYLLWYPRKYFQAFLNNNLYGACVFVGIFLNYYR